MSGILAIDAGQTAMKVRVVTGGHVIESSFGGIHTHEPLHPQLAAVARAAIEHTGERPDVLAAGVSGLRDVDADGSALLALVADLGIERVALAHDSTTSYLGARGAARGAVVASGTGVVTLGVGREKVVRVDGWGYLMGDAGSGFWVGRAALDAVMRAYDGRGPATSLTDVVRERWPVLPDAYVSLQADPRRVSVVASFAAAVAEHAEAGDAVAVRIAEDAASELALAVVTALRRVEADHDPEAAVCAIGGVFGGRVVHDAFATRLTAAGIAAALVAPAGTGLDGVQLLATLAPQHPLSSLVARS